MKPVNNPPIVARPGHSATVEGLLRYDIDSTKVLFNELLDHAIRINEAVVKDGTEPMEAPLPLASYEVADLTGPLAASNWPGAAIYVSNETGGATLAFSDGTNWRRVQDRNVVS